MHPTHLLGLTFEQTPIHLVARAFLYKKKTIVVKQFYNLSLV